MDKGYILLSRNILESDVFASQKLLKIWVWCLCKANFKDRNVPLKVGKGETIVKLKRGSFIFGRNKAEDELFIDGSTIYKSIKKLEEMEMIEILSNNQYSIITICKYDTYQDIINYKVTSKEQPSSNQVTTKEQPSNTTKSLNTLNNDNKESTYRSFKHLSLSISDFEKLKLNYTQSQIDGVLESIENYRNNKNYVSLYLTAKKWLEKEYPKTNNENPNGIGRTNQKIMKYDD
jgi:hypothetical protein